MTWGAEGAAEGSDAGSWGAKEVFSDISKLKTWVLANQNVLGGQCLMKCLTFCWVRLSQIVPWGCSQNTMQSLSMQTVGTVYRENLFIDEANTGEGRCACRGDLGKEVNRKTLVKATSIRGIWSTCIISGKDETTWCWTAAVGCLRGPQSDRLAAGEETASRKDGINDAP